jgi:hypothetical protein
MFEARRGASRLWVPRGRAGLAYHTEQLAQVRDYLRKELIRKIQLVTSEEVRVLLAAGGWLASRGCMACGWRMVDRHCLPITGQVGRAKEG